MMGNQGYDDLLYLDHPVSRKHPPMPRRDRAAQFSPFAALTGYEGEIKEAQRLTQRKIELEADERAELDEQLQLLMERLEEGEHPEMELVYFKKDEKKEGGAYINVCGIVRKILMIEKEVVLMDGTRIPLLDIAKLKEKGRLI